MNIQNQLKDELLEAYIQVSMKLWNERAVRFMPYNEALICHLLRTRIKLHPDKPYLTMKQLCDTTGILKSQMNKTLNSLEESGLITRERSTNDKRVVKIFFNDNNNDIYEKEKEHISNIVNRIINRLGTERTHEAISIFNDIATEMSIISKETNNE